MVNSKADNVLVEKITRVLVSIDLTDVTPTDIDAFLDAVDAEPFTEEKVRRLLGKSPLGRLRGAENHGPEPTPGRGRNGRTRDAATRGSCRRIYRLSCEQLEGRITPSMVVSPWGGRGLESFTSPPTDWTGEAVRLRVDQSLDLGQAEAPAGDAHWGEDFLLEVTEIRLALSATTLNSVFAGRDYQADSAIDGAVPSGEGVQDVLAWNLLSTQAVPGPEMAELQLAG
jgi:hypothetical protein